MRSVKKIDIKWSEIKSAKLKVLKFQLILTGGKIEEIALNGLSYEQNQLLKGKLMEFLNAKNIELIDESSTQIEQELPQ